MQKSIEDVKKSLMSKTNKTKEELEKTQLELKTQIEIILGLPKNCSK